MTRALAPRVAAEAVGTAMLVAIGTGAIVAGASMGSLSPAVLAVAWFVAVAVPVLAVGRLSGAHLNPAVTVFLTLGRRFPAGDVPGYLAGQCLGAFAGTFTVWAALGNEAHLGTVLPAGGDLVASVAGEFAGSVGLLAAVLYLARLRRDPSIAQWMLPPIAVAGGTYVFGVRSGLSLNPFRSLAPAVVSGTYEGLAVFFFTAFAAAILMGVLDRARPFQGDRQPAIS